MTDVLKTTSFSLTTPKAIADTSVPSQSDLRQQLLILQTTRDTLKTRLDEFTGYFAWASEKASGTSYGKEARKFFDKLELNLELAEQALQDQKTSQALQNLKVARVQADAVSSLIQGLTREISNGAEDLTTAWTGIAVADTFVGAAAGIAYAVPTLLTAATTPQNLAVLAGSVGLHAVGFKAWQAYQENFPARPPETWGINVSGYGLNNVADPNQLLPTPQHKLKTKKELDQMALQALDEFLAGKPISIDMAEFAIHAELSENPEEGQLLLDSYLKLWERKKASFEKARDSNNQKAWYETWFETTPNSQDKIKDFKEDVLNVRQAIIGESKKLKYSNKLARFTDYLRVIGDATNGINCEGQGIPLVIIESSVFKDIPAPYVIGLQHFRHHTASVVFNSDPASQKVWDTFYNTISDKIEAPIKHPAYIYYGYLKKRGLAPDIPSEKFIIADMNVPEPESYEKEDLPPTNSIYEFDSGRGEIQGSSPDEAVANFANEKTLSASSENMLENALADLLLSDVATLEEINAKMGKMTIVMSSGSGKYSESVSYWDTDQKESVGFIFGTLGRSNKQILAFENKRDQNQFEKILGNSDLQEQQRQGMAFLTDLQVKAFASRAELRAAPLQKIAQFLRNPLQAPEFAATDTETPRQVFEIYNGDLRREGIKIFRVKVKYNWWAPEDLQIISKYEEGEAIEKLWQLYEDKLRSQATAAHPISAFLEQSIQETRASIAENPKQWAGILNAMTSKDRQLYLDLWKVVDEENDAFRSIETIKPILELFEDPSVIGTVPSVATNRQPLPLRDEKEVFSVTVTDLVISDEDMKKRTQTPRTNQPEVLPVSFAWEFDDRAAPEVSVSIDFVWDLIETYQFDEIGQFIMENWTPEMSAAFFEWNKNGEHDRDFLRIYPRISQARQKRHSDLKTGVDIHLQRLRSLSDAYANHNIKLWKIWRGFNDEEQRIANDYQLPAVYHDDFSDIESHPVLKWERKKKNSNPSVFYDSLETLPNYLTEDPKYFGLVPLDFVPILQDIIRRRKEKGRR